LFEETNIRDKCVLINALSSRLNDGCLVTIVLFGFGIKNGAGLTTGSQTGSLVQGDYWTVIRARFLAIVDLPMPFTAVNSSAE